VILSNITLHNVEGDLLEIPVTAIRRPLGRTRSHGTTNFAPVYLCAADIHSSTCCADPDKVQALIDSIQEIGLKEPVCGMAALLDTKYSLMS